MLRVLHPCYCYGSFSYAVELINLTRFILKLLNEVGENSRLSIQIYYIAVFVKIANAECLQSKPYRVFTLVNSNPTGDY